jgi:hypothetical protein
MQRASICFHNKCIIIEIPMHRRILIPVPFYNMGILQCEYSQQLLVIGYQNIMNVALLLSQNNSIHNKTKFKFMNLIMRRVAAIRNKKMGILIHTIAIRLELIKNYSGAAVQLQQATNIGCLLSRAALAEMLINGKGALTNINHIDCDHNKAFALATEGNQMGCHHCKGVLARCYLFSIGCSKNSMLSDKLARESAAMGSNYGKWMLAWWYR